MPNENDSRKRKYNRVKPRRQTIVGVAEEAFLAGKTNQETLTIIRKLFPGAKTSLNFVCAYRSKVRAKGLPIKSAREMRKEAKTALAAENGVTEDRMESIEPKAAHFASEQDTSGRKTIYQVARDAMLAGKTNRQILKLIKSQFPEAKSTIRTIYSYRHKLRHSDQPEKLPKPVYKNARQESPLPTAIQATAVPETKTATESVTQNSATQNNVSAFAKTIAIACDHAGVSLKESLKEMLREQGFNVLDLGANGSESVDYPDFANAVAQAIAWGKAERGVLICGSGIGISIAANRHRHVRAALCTDGLMARLARQHNDVNVLALGARLTGVDVAKDCLLQFLNTKFDGGRHTARIGKMS